ncbi:MAG: HD domain-containing protein [Firmicutes bacterium]|nr:HD domain-containing protein [Bacillota bacterium]
MDRLEVRKRLLKDDNLSIYACLDKEAIRFNKIIEDFRPNYFRDIDRIIHSLSYSRYIDKTQVFTRQKNNHITKRMLHVQLVSKIARTIGRALCLNEDLIEAISLGHDIGHVPYGHVGERILNDLSLANNQGYFLHNVQSVRTFMNLEKNGKGSNLTVQVLDGILCHNGEEFLQKYEYKHKSADQFLQDYQNCYLDKKNNSNIVPMTLEGCVVRVSDGIAYLGRDVEDAIRLGIITVGDLPDSITKVLGSNNHDIINIIIADIIEHSLDKPYIIMSKEIYEAMNELKSFNYKYIYHKSNESEDLKNARMMFETLFEKNLEYLNNNDTSKDIFTIYLNDMDPNYIEENTNERIVIDYIAGMTDEFFVSQYNKCRS